MILKKPYAFFIRMFKPIHLLLSGLLLYLIFLSNNIIKFLNEYIYSAENLVEKAVVDELINSFLYIIPIIAIISFLIILTVMFKKNKPITFYFVGIFSFIIVIVINLYTSNFFNVLIENIVSVKTIKLIHDLVLINVIIESVIFMFLFARGLGLDFKKFDFSSDTLKLEISETDGEEFEFNVNIDFNESKRKRKERIRNLKYFYIENKLFVNIFIIIIVLIVSSITIFSIVKNTHKNKEGVYYDASSFVFKVNNTTILNTDYKGNKITDNYLVVVDSNIKSNYTSNSLYLNDFSLKIDDVRFKPVKKYFNSLIDLGNFYDEEILPLEYTDYLFVYEIPEKYIKDEMYFSYNSEGNIIDVLLQPKEMIDTTISETKKISETLKFDGVLDNIEFKINNYDIKNKYLIEYNYCIDDNVCYLSKEYLKASINENYDKVVLKLNIEYQHNSDLDVDTFYKLLSKFGAIYYKINNVWYSTYKFEEVTSKKVSSKNNVYVGVHSNIMNAEELKLVFNVRELKYEYILK